MTRTAAVAVAAAAWLGAWAAPPWHAAVLGLGLLAALARGASRPAHRRTAWRLLAALAAVGLLAGGLAGGRISQRDTGPLHEHVDGPVLSVVARVVTEPRLVRDQAWAVVRVERVDGRRVRARALAWVPAEAPLGATLEARARVVPLPPDGFGAHLRAVGAGVQLRASGPVNLVEPPAWPLRATSVLRERVRDAARAGLDDDRAALLAGITTGDARDRSDGLDARLRAAGLSHLVVVSGRHTALFLAAVLAACGALGAGYRATRWTALGMLLWFVVLVRWQPSVLRAATVAAIVLAADLLGRERDVVRVLACAVAGLLLLDPLLAGRLGFALSVAATGGVLAGVQLAERIPLPRPLAMAVAASAGAQAAVTPLLLADGLDGAGAAAVPANLIAAPAAGAAQLVGAAVAVVSLIDVGTAAWVARLAGPPLGVVLAAARLADVVPWSLLVLTVVLVMGVVAASRSRPRPALLAVASVCAVLLVVVSSPRPAAVRFLTMTALDVGQGDAILVEAPPQQASLDAVTARMLVDAGPEPVEVASLLAGRGVRSLSLAVITHPHADHAGGMAGVLESLRVAQLAIGPVTPHEREHGLADVLDAARRRGVPVVELLAGDSVTLGSAVVEVLWPAAGEVGPANDRSMVLRITGATGRLLLTGDVEAAGQRRLLSDPARLRADVLKVPHHGAATNAEGFLAAVGAQVAVVPVGAVNDYGHPADATLEQLSGLQIARTDVHGTVVVVLSPEGPAVLRARSPPPVTPARHTAQPRPRGGSPTSCCTSTAPPAPTSWSRRSPTPSSSRPRTRSRRRSSPCTRAASSGG